MSTKSAGDATTFEKLAASAPGASKLVAGLSAKKIDPETRTSILEAVLASTAPFAAAELLAAFPPRTWATLKAADAPLMEAIAECAVRSARETSFETLSPVLVDAKVAPLIAIAVLAGVDAASRPPGYSRYGVSEKQKLGVDPRWADVAIPFLGHKNADVVEAAVNLLVQVGPARREWLEPLEKAQKVLDKNMCATDGVEALLEKVAKLKPASPAEGAKPATKTSRAGAGKAAPAGPLPPEPRRKAPRVVLPKSVPVARIAKQLDAMLAAAKLSKHRALLVQPALHLVPKRVDDSKIAVGASKIGGLPDLPPAAAWPAHDGCPMGFVAQLRLEDLARLGETRLPAKGLLYVFVDDEPFGDGYLEKASVFHVAEPRKLTRPALPATFQKHRAGHPMRQAYAACSVTFVPTLTVPSSSNASVTKHLTSNEIEAFEEHVTLEQDEFSQVLGYRKQDYDAENPETAQLLFRIRTDEQADMEWGDADCLDIYVPKKDLAKGRFDRAYPYVGD